MNKWKTRILPTLYSFTIQDKLGMWINFEVPRLVDDQTRTAMLYLFLSLIQDFSSRNSLELCLQAFVHVLFKWPILPASFEDNMYKITEPSYRWQSVLKESLKNNISFIDSDHTAKQEYSLPKLILETSTELAGVSGSTRTRGGSEDLRQLQIGVSNTHFKTWIKHYFQHI